MILKYFNASLQDFSKDEFRPPNYIKILTLKMDSLPLDAIKQIALKLPYSDIVHYCNTNKAYYNVCKDNRFWLAKIHTDFGPNAPLLENDNRLSYLRLLARDIWSKIQKLVGVDDPYGNQDIVDLLKEYNNIRYGIRLAINPELPRIYVCIFLLNDLVRLWCIKSEIRRYKHAEQSYELPKMKNGDLLVFYDIRNMNYDSQPYDIGFIWALQSRPKTLKLKLKQRTGNDNILIAMNNFLKEHNLPQDSYNTSL